MKRKEEHILSDIRYWLDIRDYLINKPMDDYSRDNAVIGLVIAKLFDLQTEYRKTWGGYFSWTDYQSKLKGL